MPTVLGRVDWDLSIGAEGHRDYMVKWLVRGDDVHDGPLTIYYTPDLPSVGSTWLFGNDDDPWAYCNPNWQIRPVTLREPGLFWEVTQPFSTRPIRRCQDSSIDDPLLEPYRISGSFSKFVQEKSVDRNGNVIKSSSHELFTGQGVEFDDNRPNLKIGFNVAELPLAAYAQMVDTVNDSLLWGLGPRKIKLSNVTFTRNYYGGCYAYYSIDYEFDINFLTFDRRLVDYGTRILAPGGDPNDPRDFIVDKDLLGENKGRVLLDGNGAPLADGANPVIIDFEYYPESNFLTLGVPSSI